MKWLRVASLICCFFWIKTVTLESVPYSVVKKEGNIEIRDYGEIRVAETAVEGNRKDASNEAFSILFDYIQGNNLDNKKIPMTIPVYQWQGAEGKWHLAFYMAQDGETPLPRNHDIQLRQIPSRTMASIRFSGTMREKKVRAYEAKLRQYLTTYEIAYEENPIYAYYNSPFSLWFLRRNEILYLLTTSQK